jgi:hypothetical protein
MPRFVLLLSLLLGAGAGWAGVPSLTDCLEGSDFIAHAAQSRDNGMTREGFLDRMRTDFQQIRAFPPALRWFAQDEDDERFLLAQAEEVFDRPQAPERHREGFLRACLERAGGSAT